MQSKCKLPNPNKVKRQKVWEKKRDKNKMETLENRSRVYASVHLCICVWLMWVCTQEYTCE